MKKATGWRELKYDPGLYLQPNDLNQTLTLSSPLKKYHEGDYMCLAEDDKGNYINNTASLEIRSKISYLIW